MWKDLPIAPPQPTHFKWRFLFLESFSPGRHPCLLFLQFFRGNPAHTHTHTHSLVLKSQGDLFTGFRAATFRDSDDLECRWPQPMDSGHSLSLSASTFFLASFYPNFINRHAFGFDLRNHCHSLFLPSSDVREHWVWKKHSRSSILITSFYRPCKWVSYGSSNLPKDIWLVLTLKQANYCSHISLEKQASFLICPSFLSLGFRPQVISWVGGIL